MKNKNCTSLSFKIWTFSFDAVTTISLTNLALALKLICVNEMKNKIKKYLTILGILFLSLLNVNELSVSLLALLLDHGNGQSLSVFYLDL